MATEAELAAWLNRVRGQPQVVVDALLTRLDAIRAQTARARWEPYPWQTPPAEVPTMGAWLLLGGRGTGKTEGAARYVDEHMRGPACDPRLRGGHRALIVAPSIGDAVESCVRGPSGLQAIDPRIRFRGGIGGHHVFWPSGAEARIMGAYTPEDVERLRAAGNRCLVWLEEAAAMRRLGECMEHTSLGLRIGARPHYVISTTPKPRKEIKALVADPLTIETKGTTAEAHHLDPIVRQRLFARYGETRLGRQELLAEILDDTEGALWTLAIIEQHRRPGFDPAEPDADLRTDKRTWRRLVGVDPPGESAECGIVVGTAPVKGAAGRDHAVILDDLTVTGPPEVWGAQVVAAVRSWGCERAVVESNQGGDMVRSTIHNIDPTVRVDKIQAKETKYDRAEPVAALYAGGWVHHAQYLPELEDSLTTWVPTDSKSPDRLDALVHLVNALLKPMGPVKATVTPIAGRRVTVLSPDRRR